MTIPDPVEAIARMNAEQLYGEGCPPNESDYRFAQAIYADGSRGPKAGPLRNAAMLLRSKPDLVVGFPTDGAKNKGTSDMLSKAWINGLPIWLPDREAAPPAVRP